MIKVLLVDDEFLVCTYLRQLIDWEANGFHIVGQASNGREAQEKIAALKPDLLFLDVNMPVMDGVDLIRWLHTGHPSIKVIMLSSYSDYHYVRETMKFGARDYLLKHELNADELLRLLKQLDLKPADSPSVREEDPSRLLQDSHVRLFFEGKEAGTPPGLRGLRKPILTAAKLNLSIMPSESGTPAGTKDRGSPPAEELSRESHLIRQILTTCVEVCSQHEETTVIYLGGIHLAFLFSAGPAEDPVEQENRADRYMGIIRDTLLKYYNTYIDWKRGPRISSPSAIPALYRQLLDQPFTQPAPGSYRLSIDQEQQLIIAVSSQDQESVKRIVGEIFTLRDGREPLGGEFSILTGELLSLTVKLYQENGIPFQDTEQEKALGVNMKQAQDYFCRLLTRLIEINGGQPRFSWGVDAAVDYIQQHFKEDIGITDIGHHCGMNPSYLSTVFKRETGLGLSQYISRMRVLAAGTLMLTQNIPPTRVYELAGFRNYNNFFSLFKETTGLSPKQFRDKAPPDWITRFHPLRK